MNSPDSPEPTTELEADFWENLLYAIEDGQVVPIVGRDLLIVDTEKGPLPFHRMVAMRLAAQLRVPSDRLPAEYDINDVACAYKEFRGDPSVVNSSVLRIIRSLSLPTSEPLNLLAEIPNLHLFISTTIDTLLEDAIARTRGCKPAVVAFPPATDLLDYDESLLRTYGSVVFHILGLLSSSSPFAVTEGQMLEQMHDFMTSEGRPKKLIAKLQQSHLLILGVDFPDWLARFLLRIARKNPLWDSRTITEVFVDPRALKEDFARFLRYFSTQRSTIYPNGSSVDFVRELHRRWFDKNPKDKGVGQIAASSGELSTWSPGSIFVSHASEDHDAAFRLANELTMAGLEVWVDRRLKPGDDFRDIINYHIRECCAFVAVLSRNTNIEDGPGRWFRDEWYQARDLSRRYTGTDRNFLFPVVVDDTPSGSLTAIRQDLFGRSAVLAPAGAPPPELIKQLDVAQKAYRKQLARA
jgi:hypothetical protein